MSLGPTLETDRLILRPPEAQDLDGFAELVALEESARFIGGVQPRSVAWRNLCTMAGSWATQGFAMFSVLDRASGRWIGRVGPWMPEGWPGTEVGWGLLRSAWGQGYACEAATAAIDWAFDTLGWTEVVHCIAPDNLNSAAVARRLGSANRGPGRLPAPYEASKIDLWGQTREQWRGRRTLIPTGTARVHARSILPSSRPEREARRAGTAKEKPLLRDGPG